MPARLFYVALSVLVAVAACASPRSGSTSGPTFIVVRHAEKGSEDPRDPSLSAAGRLRADALVENLGGQPLAAAYASAFKRTQQTAQPSARASGIEVTTYDAAQPAAEFASQLRAKHAHGTVLVVGHSNTVPDIVAALCACAVAPLADDDYGDLYAVRLDGAGGATLDQRTY